MTSLNLLSVQPIVITSFSRKERDPTVTVRPWAHKALLFFSFSSILGFVIKTTWRQFLEKTLNDDLEFNVSGSKITVLKFFNRDIRLLIVCKKPYLTERSLLCFIEDTSTHL